ncbi:hypothetical protein WJX74_001429 [Apatococcus lobatus]|uniref:HIG1 domain-containing protein n=2 Tax=Apatococcus TaxID=904362 RepID=A0AAW1RRH4_9CHLO
MSSAADIKDWLQHHKLKAIGSFWLTTVGASAAVQYARPIPTQLKVIHTRVYAQAFTLAALAAAGIVEYSDHRTQTNQDLVSYRDRVRILEERLHIISPRPGTEIGSGPTAEDKSKN